MEPTKDDVPTCCHCGNLFEGTAKGYNRRSLNVFLKLKGQTLREFLEELFSTPFTPEREPKQFFCYACFRKIRTMSTNLVHGQIAFDALKEAGGTTGFLSPMLDKLRCFSFQHERQPVPPSTSTSTIDDPPRRKRRRLELPHTTTETLSPESDSVDPWDHTYLSSVENRRHAPHTPTPVVKQVVKRKYRLKLRLKNADEADRVCRLFRSRKYRPALKGMLGCRVGFQKAVNDHFVSTIRSEVKSIDVSKMNDLKGHKTLTEIQEFDWTRVSSEMKENCPLLTTALETALNANRRLDQTTPTLQVQSICGTIMAIILYQYNPRVFSHFQEMNSVQMWMSGCRLELMSRFNHLNLCVGISATTGSVDRIEAGYNSEVLGWKENISDFLQKKSNNSASIPSSQETSDEISNSQTDPDPQNIPPEPMEDSQPSSSVVNGNAAQPVEAEDKGKYGYSICYDNAVQKPRYRNYTKDTDADVYNMVHGYAAKDRISSVELSDEVPSTADIMAIPLSDLLPSKHDDMLLQDEMKIMIKRILVEHLPMFNDLTDDITLHIPHKYTHESTLQSHMVPLGVVDKDRLRVGDTNDILLENYQSFVPVKPDGKQLLLPIVADSLSGEDVINSQNSKIDGITRQLQLNGLTMNVQEWNKQSVLLQDIYDDLYKNTSSGELGTLCHLRSHFKQRMVQRRNVKDSYDKNEEFLEFCCIGYVLLACMNYLGLEHLQDEVEIQDKNDKLDLLHTVTENLNKDIYLSSQELVDQVLSGTVEDTEHEYCVCGQEFLTGSAVIYCNNMDCQNGMRFHLECVGLSEDEISNDDPWYCSPECNPENYKNKKSKSTTCTNLFADGKRAYTLKVIWSGLNHMVRKDAVKENDGNRMMLHWKFDLLGFMEHHHTKYFTIGHRLLMSINGGVSPRLQHTLTWNRTVNTDGGLGNNISVDQQMELFKKDYKESLKETGLNITMENVARHSQMMEVAKFLRKVYDKNVSCNDSHKESREVTPSAKDVTEFVSLLQGEDLFNNISGRWHNSFKNMDHVLYPNTKAYRLRNWLEKLKLEMTVTKQTAEQMLEVEENV